MTDMVSGAPPTFETARFALLPLAPFVARQLVERLLLSDTEGSEVVWVTDRTPEGARTFGREMEAAAERGACRMWSILKRDDQMVIGVLIARNASDGFDVQVLVDTEHDVYDPVEEVCDPVLEWLGENAAELWCPPPTLH